MLPCIKLLPTVVEEKVVFMMTVCVCDGFSDTGIDGMTGYVVFMMTEIKETGNSKNNK